MKAKIIKGSKYHRIEKCEDGTIEVELNGYDEKQVQNEDWPSGISFLLDAYLVHMWPQNINYNAVKNAICRAVKIYPSDEAYDSTYIRIVNSSREPYKNDVETSFENTSSVSWLFHKTHKNKPILSKSEGIALDRYLFQVYFELKRILE